MLSLFGSGVGRGIAIGHAYVLQHNDIQIPITTISEDEIDAEIARFEKAVADTEAQYQTMLQQLPKNAPEESAAFIEAHQMMLKDPLLVDSSIDIIRQQQINAEQALDQQSKNLISVFEQMHDTYLRNKKTDVQHITNRLLRNLLGIVSHSLEELQDADVSGRIIVGKDLSPAETIYIKNRKVGAFVTDLGSLISHTAIVARTMKIPAVVGLHGSRRIINEDDLLIVDGLRGVVLINPDKHVLQEYKTRQRKIREQDKQLVKLTHRVSKTLDGEKIKLLTNIESSSSLRDSKRVNSGGIGLFRTEYLFMNREQAPSENEQLRAYKHIVKGLNRPISIRTLDIGGDKRLDFNYPQKSSSESALGLRAIRLCLNNMALFKPQLRAILRASAYGKVSIMLPMLSNYDEINQALALIKQTKAELRSEGINYDNRIQIGGMIEVPAAAIMAEIFAKKLDFLSIGTNDLIQYTLAIDRVDDAVNYLYDPLHPAVLQLIQRVIKAGNNANIPVSLCGEMAGNIKYTRLLLGLGLRNFSMDANYLLAVKQVILDTDLGKLKYQVQQIMRADTAAEAQLRLAKLNAL